MKITVSDDKTRLIASREHNIHVAEGINQHRETQVAPSGLLNSFSQDLEKQIKYRHQAIEKVLNKILGAPFYSDIGFILYNGDSLEFLQKLQNESINIHLTVTSPPYNIGKEYEHQMVVKEYINWCTGWMKQIFDITTNNGALWLNVGYLEVPEKGLCVPIPYLLWNKSPFYLIQEVVWKYGAGVSAKSRLSPRNEKWLFYVKNPKDYTFNLDDIRDPNVKYPNQKKNGKYRCNPLGKNPSDVWDFPKVTTGNKRSSKERAGHPAQFPLAVVERVIRASSNQTDVVLDPFAGSCSSGIAASGLGRVFVGFELRSDYCHLAANRFEEFKEERINSQRQAKLF